MTPIGTTVQKAINVHIGMSYIRAHNFPQERPNNVNFGFLVGEEVKLLRLENDIAMTTGL